jgi:hypothetical protein
MLTKDEMQCAAVPLTELLRQIPHAQRLEWTEPDGLKATHFVPVGRYAHEAAAEIVRLTKETNALRRVLGDATFRQMNGLTPVLRDLQDEAPVRPPCEVPNCDGLAMVCLKHVPQSSAEPEAFHPSMRGLSRDEQRLLVEDLWAASDGCANCAVKFRMLRQSHPPACATENR